MRTVLTLLLPNSTLLTHQQHPHLHLQLINHQPQLLPLRVTPFPHQQCHISTHMERTNSPEVPLQPVTIANSQTKSTQMGEGRMGYHPQQLTHVHQRWVPQHLHSRLEHNSPRHNPSHPQWQVSKANQLIGVDLVERKAVYPRQCLHAKRNCQNQYLKW